MPYATFRSHFSLFFSGQLSRDHDLDCVTLDGDQVSRRGAIKGGHRGSTSKSASASKGKGRRGDSSSHTHLTRLQAISLLQQAERDHRTVIAEGAKTKAAAVSCDREVTLLQGEALRLEGVRRRAVEEAQAEQAGVARERDEAVGERRRANVRRTEAAAMRRGRDALLDRAADALTEVGQPLVSNLTEVEQEELKSLQAAGGGSSSSSSGMVVDGASILSISSLAAAVVDRHRELEEAQAARDALQARLSDNLRPREKELNALIWKIDHGGYGETGSGDGTSTSSSSSSSVSSSSSTSSSSSSRRVPRSQGGHVVKRRRNPRQKKKPPAFGPGR